MREDTKEWEEQERRQQQYSFLKPGEHVDEKSVTRKPNLNLAVGKAAQLYQKAWKLLGVVTSWSMDEGQAANRGLVEHY